MTAGGRTNVAVPGDKPREMSGSARDLPAEMRALRMTDAGDASFEFADVPRPVAGDGEMLIEVALAGVNSADVVGPQVNITGTRPAVMRRARYRAVGRKLPAS
jgi:hypothetical protein